MEFKLQQDARIKIQQSSEKENKSSSMRGENTEPQYVLPCTGSYINIATIEKEMYK